MKISTTTALDYCKYVTDGTHDSPKAKDDGFKLITSKHLKRYEIDFNSANFISEEDYKKVIERSCVEQWDILFSMIGTIGNLYIETNSNIKYACKNMGIFQMGGDEMKSKWLYYYLQSPKAVEYIAAVSRGTTQGYVPLGALRKMPVDVVENNVRDKIVTFLWNLDEKIKTNIEVNNNLVAYKLMLDTSSFPDISFGKRASRIFVSLCDSRVRFFICRNIGCTMSSKRRSVSVSGNIVGYALRISVFRLLKTLPLLRLISC